MSTPSDERIAQHPCYSEQAHHFFARMHLAVAPGCNIQCNYCNRKYDCANESRPGVVSERLKPEEALAKVYHVAQEVKELTVIGIAGPGDALANPNRTFRTLDLIRSHFPDLTLCLSTNGLALAEHADRIVEAGVEHVTVTLNTFDPATAQKIYAWVAVDGKRRNDIDAMERFLAAQQEGIKTLVRRGVLVKVNSLLMPGINETQLPALSKKLKLMGVFLHNIMPLIARPEHGTVFGLEGRPEPTERELEDVRAACGDIKQMAHCRQCRADAVGKLGEDGFKELTVATIPPAPAIPVETGAAARAQWRNEIGLMMEEQRKKAAAKASLPGTYRVALCTKEMGRVNQHFGHAEEFHIYEVTDGTPKFVNVRRVGARYCDGAATCGDGEELLPKIIATVADCDAVVSLQVGYGPHKALEAAGVLPVCDIPYAMLDEAALHAATLVAARRSKSTATVSEKEAHA
jgi:nitrogen fixation protein NifB